MVLELQLPQARSRLRALQRPGHLNQLREPPCLDTDQTNHAKSPNVHQMRSDCDITLCADIRSMQHGLSGCSDQTAFKLHSNELQPEAAACSQQHRRTHRRKPYEPYDHDRRKCCPIRQHFLRLRKNEVLGSYRKWYC
jgi:hypothetical protein